MKKLLLCLLISAPFVYAQSDPCNGDTACQYRVQAEKKLKQRQLEAQKEQNYRDELLNVQRAQLEETQKQNVLLEQQLEEIDLRQEKLEDQQQEQAEKLEEQQFEIESRNRNQPVK